ncbi:MAG: type I DNA topoisomerase [Myxococcota bacterium]|nr:type I DNA topoisomerase [Myxococcota bacterium]
MSKSLVIVESPAKARTIAGYLGKEYVVESSIGHIRDLPRRASDVPAKYKKEPWARLGVDVENDFRPLYIVDPDKKQHITKLKKLLKEADTLYLATDEDREGESIAWHLLEVLSPKVPVKRMVFHEITKKAIQSAIQNPRQIDQRLVDAQEARRILDRLFGYEVSPVLWKKVMPQLSAGRVQSVATRIVVERERARIRFNRAKYWDLEAQLAKADGAELTAKLYSLDGKRLASGKDFDESGKVGRKDVVVLDEKGATELAEALKGKPFTVKSVERKPYKRTPAPPFMTSTLQQEASRKLRFDARRAMRTAQRLYESGFITYMRTDSTTLSDTAITAARKQIEDLYGKDHMPAHPRSYANKVKNAQEAHEAIRPSGDNWKTPEEVAREVGRDEARLYELIWKRTIASQMEDARGETLTVRIEAEADGKQVELGVSGRTITFPGFLRAYVEGSDDPEAELENREKHLPPLSEGEKLEGKRFEPQGHETQPPARFTEASLVRALEELGVGRPSTYASIMGTIVARGYVWKKGSALIPSWKAFAVTALLEQHFPQLVDYTFTARMEDELDAIASGDEQVVPWLERFYLGPNGQAPANENGVVMETGLKEMVSEKLGEIDAREINSLPLGEDEQGRTVVVRVGRYGPYLQRGDDEGSRPKIPEDLPPDELTLEKAIELLEAPSDDRELGADPETGEKVIARAGRFGPYVQLGDASADRKEKPKTASLFKTMSLETITLEEALKLLSLPREVGKGEDGEPILALNGRYGPYLKHGKETRSLEKEEQIFAIGLEEAKKVLAQPKQRGRRSAATAEPLKTLGEDPTTGEKILVKEGRWGPYVTDGETNASLRKGDSVEDITTDRAIELLQMRRDRGPVKKKRASKKKTSKKKAKKKTSKKKAKKKTSKKAKKKTSKKADG